MEYRIEGASLPVLICEMKEGESIFCESGKMAWMDDGLKMETKGGGFGKVFGRMLNNEALFENEYHARKDGEIAFASSVPGTVMAVDLRDGKSVVVQKGSYMARFGNITSKVFLQKKIGSGIFGGEGFIMNQFSGSGTLFLEVDGSAHRYYLEPGEKKIVDTGYLVMMDSSVKMEIERIKGVKNMILGGEGLFNTVLTGPGEIILQSMPLAVLKGLFTPTTS